MNMYKFGNYICKLREEQNMTQADLAKVLDVSDKSVSKWENGQAFPRIETFEKLAQTLNTTVEDIFSASKDGVTRVCFTNEYSYTLQLNVNGKFHTIYTEESKWVEVTEKTLNVKVSGELITDEAFDELREESTGWIEKITAGFIEKATKSLLNAALQVDCSYRITNFQPDSVFVIDVDDIEIYNEFLLPELFIMFYPKIVSDCNARIELMNARGVNIKKAVKSMKFWGAFGDSAIDFGWMILMYPIRKIYLKHLCKPHTIKKNIINAEEFKKKSERRSKYNKKIGCFGALGILALIFTLWFLLDAFVFSTLFVNSERPFLVATDYSTITYYDDVYTRINDLPEEAEPILFFGGQIWENSRTDGLSKWDQSMQDDMVQIFEDDEGNQYLWLVEDYTDTIVAEKENGDNKEYEDFEKHYVYICKNPSQSFIQEILLYLV